ncbi:CPBP family intramembrane glutamic endopeptidase [Streptococcus cuniculipharyngis]|uniref:CPBP family intramembrane metalloprotease n=1 Tax=Streptococcus cuniculipharyngis TaxID=1562651 RepID=A0A5C5SFQ1_9STRE|nr:type II CAAX endopeptidase family protein [Streptococcus cuniculipharyngis]TWS98835.1 CPBP family intramembrane metalloprotease [Streptococcus cuniculipharyngis]
MVKKVIKQLGLFVLALSVNLVPMLFLGLEARTPMPLKWFLGMTYLISVPLIIKKVWQAYTTYESEEVKQEPFTKRDFGIAFLFFLATRLVAIVGSLLNYLVNGNAVSYNDAALMATNEQLMKIFPLYFICFNLAIGVFAPILEELVFRGFVTKYFFNEDKKWPRLLVVSFLFTLPHLNPLDPNGVEFSIYFALAVIFYLAYARRGNIKDAILVHLLNNSLLFLISIISYLFLTIG